MRSLKALIARGQSPWYDNLSRKLISSGDLEELIEEGIVGITSNPTIFDNAISNSNDYDSALAKNAKDAISAQDTYWDLVCKDIADAADILRNVYDSTNQLDGYVSVEVSPLLANDTVETIVQANELFTRISKDNVMIKIPATKEGIGAIEAVISNNIPVNVTLIFSVERYQEVINAYKKGIANLRSSGINSTPACVASFFISRLDAKVDEQLEEGSDLIGKAANANASMAYEIFQREFKDSLDNPNELMRPLWASTSIKNKSFSPTLYIDELLAKNTVNTLPHTTIEAIRSQPDDFPSNDLDDNREKHSKFMERILEKIDIDAIMQQLEDEGVESFKKSYHSCLESISARLEQFTTK